jgi:hypothetical protein
MLVESSSRGVTRRDLSTSPSEPSLCPCLTTMHWTATSGQFCDDASERVPAEWGPPTAASCLPGHTPPQAKCHAVRKEAPRSERSTHGFVHGQIIADARKLPACPRTWALSPAAAWIEQNMPEFGTVTQESFQGGSNWSSAYAVTTSSGKKLFVKTSLGRDEAMFRGEALGLRAMAGM